MKTKDYVVSSRNVFADLKVPNPEEALLKARLAVAITKAIKGCELTQKEAGKLMGLKQPLEEGQHFPVVLQFERAGKITVDMFVQKNAKSSIY